MQNQQEHEKRERGEKWAAAFGEVALLLLWWEGVGSGSPTNGNTLHFLFWVESPTYHSLSTVHCPMGCESASSSYYFVPSEFLWVQFKGIIAQWVQNWCVMEAEYVVTVVRTPIFEFPRHGKASEIRRGTMRQNAKRPSYSLPQVPLDTATLCRVAKAGRHVVVEEMI